MIKKTILIAVCLLSVGNFLLAQHNVHTTSKQVQIVDTAFYMPQLNRTRRVWIYLPESYTTARKKHYPVIYMHDGQNLFDKSTSFSGEWGVDEAMDTLGASIKESIIVGIDNGGNNRLAEYAPYDAELKNGNNTISIKSQGDAYVDFIVKTLKPFIDKNYRTCRCRKNTSVAGSSMGGLISFYAILKYPKVFGAAGVFSPSFWVAPTITDLVEKSGKKVKGKIYFYAGKAEGENMVTDMLTVFNKMNLTSKAKLTTVIRTEGKHNEATWREEFPIFYKWLHDSSK